MLVRCRCERSGKPQLVLVQARFLAELGDATHVSYHAALMIAADLIDDTEVRPRRLHDKLHVDQSEN